MVERTLPAARRARQTAQLCVESLRDMLTSVGPVLLFACVLLAAAYWWLDPQPPRTVTLATGPAGSAYAEFGQRYAEALKRDGIQVTLLTTDGPAANLQALRDHQANVAFVRGGSADMSDDAEHGVMSLGALFYEPLWLFYRPAALSNNNKTNSKGTSARSEEHTSELQSH